MAILDLGKNVNAENKQFPRIDAFLFTNACFEWQQIALAFGIKEYGSFPYAFTHDHLDRERLPTTRKTTKVCFDFYRLFLGYCDKMPWRECIMPPEKDLICKFVVLFFRHILHNRIKRASFTLALLIRLFEFWINLSRFKQCSFCSQTLCCFAWMFELSC